MNFKQRRNELLHGLYKISVIVKGVDGILEVAGGILLIFFSPLTITRSILFFAHHELVEDPRHPLINYLYQIASGLSLQRRQFYSLLFLSHGAVKLVMVSGLMRNKMWAYPATMVIFTAFVFYQTFEMYFSPSILLVAITVIDIFVVLLIGREYQTRKEARSMRVIDRS